MSYTKTLGRPRTVRFSNEVDRKLSALAAREGKSVSQLIRESVLHDLQESGQTAGEWILEVSKRPPPRRELDAEFVRAYEDRHA
ncbi:MAG TPA: ribbon-helix-helix protein, CopG family [Candidatus Binatia bacterium]|nr:ribbon-helix-helix protein, CopG family [Candidatus Binatia bacterium]